MWRGEEKGAASAGNPRMELLEKFDWVYEKLPFVMAYYAKGYDFTICAIYQRGDGNSVGLEDLLSFDLAQPEDRLDLVIVCSNLARLLRVLQFICETQNEVVDMPHMQRMGRGKTVRVFGRKVEKKYALFPCTASFPIVLTWKGFSM